MKDIFIDNNVAKNFNNPLDPHYKNLLAWLKNNKETEKSAKPHLVISSYLRQEYIASNRDYVGGTNIMQILKELHEQDRLNNITDKQIATFHEEHLSEKNMKAIGIPSKYRKLQLYRILKWNKDLNHLPAVFLSSRKMVLTYDTWFTAALRNFPGFLNQAKVRSRPEELDYSA